VPDRGLIINGAEHVKAIAQHVSVNTDSFTLSITLNSMKPRITIVACLVFAILWLDHSYLAAQSLNPNQQLIIFDTDIGNDVDDVLALGMIHALQARKECKLLAVTITKDHPQAAAFTDAVNTFYGHGEIPIGVCSSGVTPEAGKFNVLVDQVEGGRPIYPYDVEPRKAVTVLREALANAEDHSVAIVQVGFSTNLANLLKSSADQVSPLNGRQLVEKKASLLSIMAGAFQKIPDADGNLRDHHEYNVVKDLQSASFLADNWPTEIVWSGFEIGLALRYPHQSIERDYNYHQHHPLKDAYYAYSPPPHDRPTWDLTSVLYAIRPERNYFDLSPRGKVSIDQAGVSHFEIQPSGKHRYLKLTDIQKIRAIETLVGLASQPPLAAR